MSRHPGYWLAPLERDSESIRARILAKLRFLGLDDLAMDEAGGVSFSIEADSEIDAESRVVDLLDRAQSELNLPQHVFSYSLPLDALDPLTMKEVVAGFRRNLDARRLTYDLRTSTEGERLAVVIDDVGGETKADAERLGRKLILDIASEVYKGRTGQDLEDEAFLN